MGDDAASDVTDSTDMAVASPVSASTLKRFGVMPHFGDLDTMVDRRVIPGVNGLRARVAIFWKMARGGTVQEYAEKLQKVVNTAYKTGLLTVQVAVIPVARDQLFPALQAGYGDIVMAGTTITESRRAEVDFTDPVSKPLKEILITGPSASALRSLDDLAGKAVYVRLSSSYAGKHSRIEWSPGGSRQGADSYRGSR